MQKSKKTLRPKTYRLIDNKSPETFMLKSGRNGELIYKDPEKDFISRAIRHCPNQRSIFIDEQDQFALVQPIIFRKGYIDVPAEDQLTQQFLDYHPSNGKKFEEINEEMEAKEAIADHEMRNDAMMAVREVAKEKMGIHKLKSVVSVLKGSVEEANVMGIEELKAELYNEIDNNVKRFFDDKGNVNIFDDQSIINKYVTLRAIRENIIVKSPNGRSMLWARDKKVIVSAPRSIDLVDFFAEYLNSDEGQLVAEEIGKRS